MSGFHNSLSNLPPGVSENDPDAPWNQPDAEEKPHWVTLQVRIDACDDDDARDQVERWLRTAKINGVVLNGCDYQIDEARVDE